MGYDDNNVYIIYLKPQITELNFKEILINSITDTHIINTINNNYNDNNNDNDNDNDKYDKTKEDYNKFSKKNIITVIFALNIINYIIIDWKDKETNENLINRYNTEIKTEHSISSIKELKTKIEEIYD